MTNRQVRAAETRKKIIAAAKVLIAAKGFDNTSIDDIAKKAGVSTGSFYTYFKKKEEVVEELNKTDFYRLAEIVNERKDKPLLDRLQYYAYHFLKEIEETGIEICRQWVRNNLSPGNMLYGREKTTKYQHDYYAVQAILQEAIRRGELEAALPLEELTLFINAELYGLMIAWCMTDGELVGSERVDAFCSTVLETILTPYVK